MMSDESENDGMYADTHESDIYYKKYKLLLDECAQLQKSNEILVFRIQEVNKIVRRRQKEVKFFKRRLINNYGEDWTVIPNLDLVKEEEEQQQQQQQQQQEQQQKQQETKSVGSMMYKEKIKEEKLEAAEEKPPPTTTTKSGKKPTKRKTTKSK